MEKDKAASSPPGRGDIAKSIDELAPLARAIGLRNAGVLDGYNLALREWKSAPRALAGGGADSANERTAMALEKFSKRIGNIPDKYNGEDMETALRGICRDIADAARQASEDIRGVA